MRLLSLLLLTSFLIQLGCQDHGVSVPEMSASQYEASIDGQNLKCTVNQRFTLTLGVSADGGYQWDWTIANPSVVQLDSTSVKPPLPPVVGGEAVEMFHFRTTGVGVSRVKLIQHRVWEPNIPPIGSIEFLLYVQP